MAKVIVESHGIPYEVEAYPTIPAQDKAAEQLQFCRIARDHFYRLAEEGIAQPSYFDSPAEHKMGISKRALEVCRAQLGPLPKKADPEHKEEARLAKARLAGACVNRVEVLAEAYIGIGDRREQAGQSGTSIREEMEELIRELKELLPYVYLKSGRSNGRAKPDIDGVLNGIFGDVYKSAAMPPAYLREHEYENRARAMYQTDKLVEWAKAVAGGALKEWEDTKDDATADACRPLLKNYVSLMEDLGKHAKIKLSDPRRKDVENASIRKTNIQIEDAIGEMMASGSNLGSLGKSLLNASSCILEITEQGEKPVTVSIITGADAMRKVTAAMKSMLAGPRYKDARKAVKELEKTTEEYMRNIVRYGPPSQKQEKTFAKARREVNVAAEELATKRSGHEKQNTKIANTLSEGVDILGSMAPDFSKGDPEAIADAMRKALVRADAFIARIKHKQRDSHGRG